MPDSSETWQNAAKKKVASTVSKIPVDWRLSPSDIERARNRRDITGDFIEQFLNDEEKTIIRLDSVAIVNKIRSREYTALQVTIAFCKTAATAHQINNCLHEIFFDQALQRAQELDDRFEDAGSPAGPLHGLPVSLKDQFHVRGTDTTMGYIGWIGTHEGKTDPELVGKVDSQLVTELRSLGAVLYCKTSVPQSLMIGETENNLIGRTLNPLNQNLSCGGSSGGEGALLALRGSSVGLGTDIGGSVRIPAAFCGTFAIKPTHDRLSYRDMANSMPGQTAYPSTVGFLSTSLDALHLMMTSIISTKPWLRDPRVVNIPWRQHITDETLSRATETGKSNEKLPLKLGIIWNDGEVTPHPPIVRGLRDVVAAIKAAGHKVVEWKPPSHATATRIHHAFLAADHGHEVHRQLKLSGEPLLPELEESFDLQDPMSLLDYQDRTVEARRFEESYLDYWNSTASDGQIVDAVISPVAPHAAVIPGKYYHSAYTQTFNLLDYSSVVLPVTQARKDIDRYDDNFAPLSETDRKNWKAYDPEIYDGAPVGLQIVTRKYEEEKAWAIGKIVHALMQATKVSTEAGRDHV